MTHPETLCTMRGMIEKAVWNQLKRVAEACRLNPSVLASLLIKQAIDGTPLDNFLRYARANPAACKLDVEERRVMAALGLLARETRAEPATQWYATKEVAERSGLPLRDVFRALERLATTGHVSRMQVGTATDRWGRPELAWRIPS